MSERYRFPDLETMKNALRNTDIGTLITEIAKQKAEQNGRKLVETPKPENLSGYYSEQVLEALAGKEFSVHELQLFVATMLLNIVDANKQILDDDIRSAIIDLANDMIPFFISDEDFKALYNE